MNAVISKESRKMTTRILGAVLVASAFVLAAAASASAAAPTWKLTAASEPTNFAAGSAPTETGPAARPQYVVMATNVGSAPTSGTITFTDTLPAGLTPTNPVATHNLEGGFYKIPCNVTGQTVTCADSTALPPGKWVQILIPVEVDEDVSGSVTNQASIVGGGAPEATRTTTTTISEAIPPFDFLPGSAGLSAFVTGADGGSATQAGSHPFALTVDLGLPTQEPPGGGLFHAGHPMNLKVHLPRGMVANPQAVTSQCTEAQLESGGEEQFGGCPDAAVVGAVVVLTNLGSSIYPKPSALYNMVPPPGVAAEFAFDAAGVGIFIHLMGQVNSAGEYELGTDTDNILARRLNPLINFQAQLWGDPSDPGHDAMRGKCTDAIADPCSRAAKTRLDTPLLTMPSSCGETLTATASARSWEEPSRTVNASTAFEDSLGNPTSTDGCNKLEFAPEFEAKPTTNLADAPSGLDVNLHVPQSNGFEPATANFKDVKVILPAGMAINPSTASGQGACGSAQIGLLTPIGQSPIHFSEAPGSCPQEAKVGSVEVGTPLLDHPLSGGVYLAKPFDNPFGSLIAIYLDVEDPATGVVAKLAGKVEANPQTGQLTTTFSENPELPIEDVKVSLFKGPRAPLTTPIACGTYSTAAEITPWSTPEGVDAQLSDSFGTSVAAAGSGACPTSEATAPSHPAFAAGTIAPQAAAYSPFVLKLSREDGSQRLTGLDTTLPKGLIGKLAGVASCSEAAIAHAQARSQPNQGALEQQSPSCPAASEVGTVTVGAGSGIAPFYAQGHAYLAGPYKGAPLSLAVITPAVAGPFDLGAVTVRVALRIDPETVQVRAVSDPLPTILDGIPLDVRSVAVKLSRPDFTLNPTSCDPMAVIGVATSALGQGASLTSPFQVGGCSALGFKPKLAFSLKGATKRAGHPSLRATLRFPQGAYANTARAQVTLPHSEFIDQAHFRTICTRVQFAAKQCPAGSVYGHVRATSPLVDYAIEGPVYLRSSTHQLPDLVAALSGPASQPVEVNAVGRVDSVNGGIRTTFESFPDVPAAKIVLTMKGGKKGLFVNSTNLCKSPHRATALFDGQNGKTFDSRPVMEVSCKGKGRKGGRRKAHR